MLWPIRTALEPAHEILTRDGTVVSIRVSNTREFESVRDRLVGLGYKIDGYDHRKKRYAGFRLHSIAKCVECGTSTSRYPHHLDPRAFNEQICTGCNQPMKRWRIYRLWDGIEYFEDSYLRMTRPEQAEQLPVPAFISINVMRRCYPSDLFENTHAATGKREQ